MKRHALFVGVDQYSDPTIQNLNYPSEDANELASAFKLLLKFDRVEKLLNPARRTDILDKVQDLTRGLGPGDLFLFFFAGHGFRVKENHVLVCAKDEYMDLEDEYEGLAVGQLKKRMRGAWDRMLILDACQNDIRAARGTDTGATARDLSLIHERDAEPIAGDGSQILVTSCSEGQKALEVSELKHGLFTYAILDSITSFANDRRRIDIEGLRKDLGVRMRGLIGKYRLSGQQEPLFTIPANAASLILLDGKDSCDQPPLRATHAAEGVVHASAPSRPALHSPGPRRRRGWGRLAFTWASGLAVLAALVWIAREWFGPIDSLWHPSLDSLSAEEQYERACFYEGRHLFRRRNRLKALTWYRASAENGSADGQFKLGFILRNGGFGQVRNEFEAVEWFRKAMEQDHAGALSEMGRYCLLGTAGVEKDEEKAIEYLRRSVDKGDWLGLMLLGVVYQYGIGGIGKNPERAEALFRKAAGKRSAEAKRYLALFVFETAKDSDYESRKEALSLLREAAGEKDATAQCEYGRVLLFGLYGVSPDVSGGISLLRAAAEADNDEAQYILALCLLGEEDVKVKQDEEAGIALLRKAAHHGHSDAQSLLAAYLFKGEHGVALDRKQAVEWYQKAANAGHAGAQAILGNCYAQGEGVAKDETIALEWYRKAAEQGHRVGQHNLGFFNANGLGGLAKNEVEAAEWYRKAADQGYAPSQNNLGVFYANGLGGLPKDEALAAEWYRKAADQEDDVAQLNLAQMYEDGRGVPQDDVEAAKWYRKAAEQGHVEAQFNLGVMYYYGRGVPQDDMEAAKWYRKAADQGDAGAQNNLGNMYDDGRGVPQDYAEAAKWHREAAEQGYALGQFNLGNMYYFGRGVPQDYAAAAKWYRMAAEQGYATAQYNLGVCYRNGQGVSQDDGEAAKWFHRAAEQGDENAKASLRDMGI